MYFSQLLESSFRFKNFKEIGPDTKQVKVLNDIDNQINKSTPFDSYWESVYTDDVKYVAKLKIVLSDSYTDECLSGFCLNNTGIKKIKYGINSILRDAEIVFDEDTKDGPYKYVFVVHPTLID